MRFYRMWVMNVGFVKGKIMNRDRTGVRNCWMLGTPRPWIMLQHEDGGFGCLDGKEWGQWLCRLYSTVVFPILLLIEVLRNS